MKPARFEYERPHTIEDAVALLADESEETRVMAGGQSLMPMLAMRLSRPERIIDINEIPALQRIDIGNDHVEIGACTRQSVVELSDAVGRHLPVLVDALRLIGHPTIRHRGTVGGSLAHADPAAELPAVAVALGAQFVIQSVRGTRVASAEDFLIGHFTSCLAPDELLVAVRFPLAPPSTHAAISEYSRRSGDFAVAGAVCAVTVELGIISDARVVGIGVDAAPRRCPSAEALLNAGDITSPMITGQIEAAAAALARDCNPTNDIHGSADYRRRVVAETFRRAARSCLASAQVHEEVG